MKCKPNELAIVTRVGNGDTLDEAVLRSIIGRTVRVTRIDSGDVWLIEDPILFNRVAYPLPHGVTYATGVVEGISDQHLTPLRGLGADEFNALELALGITSGAFA